MRANKRTDERVAQYSIYLSLFLPHWTHHALLLLGKAVVRRVAFEAANRKEWPKEEEEGRLEDRSWEARRDRLMRDHLRSGGKRIIN